MKNMNASRSQSWKSCVLWLRAELSYLLWWAKQCLRNRRLYRFPCLNGSANGVTIPSPSTKSPEQKEWRDSVPCTARLLGLTLLVVALWIGVLPRAQAEPVVLAWDYPTNELYGIIFRVKFTTALSTPLTNWLLIAETTNTTIRLDMIPAVYFFAVTASNFWSKSESPFSNIVYTPPVVKTNVALTISK